MKIEARLDALEAALAAEREARLTERAEYMALFARLIADQTNQSAALSECVGRMERAFLSTHAAATPRN